MGRRIAILGDMLELGNREQDLHAGLAGDVIAAEPFSVFTVGSRMRYLRDALPSLLRGPHFDKAEEVMGPLLAEIKDGDVILIKGSFSIHMGSVVDALRNRSSQDKVI